MSINPWGTKLFSGFYSVNDPAIAAKIVAERLAEDFLDHSPVSVRRLIRLGLRLQ
jgi:hypothetical protein